MDKINLKDKRIYGLIIFLLTHIILGLLIQFGGAYALNGILTGIEGLSAKYQEYGELVNQLTTPNPGILIYTALVAPMIEELIFRLGLIGLGKKFVGFWVANVCSSILFGLYHGNWIQEIYAFIFGIVLGLIYEYSKGYAASLLVHLSVNISGIVLSSKIQSTQEPWLDILVGMIILIIAGVVVFNIIKNGNNKRVPVV